MRITIAQRLCPYSHTPGTCCLLPGSSLRFQFFPTRVAIADLSGAKPENVDSLDINLSGPVKDFTVQQDLEKGIIRVWGHYQEGFVRYSFSAGAMPGSYILIMEKVPKEGVRFEALQKTVHAKDVLHFSRGKLVPEADSLKIYEPSRLSLGSHKSQDWDLVKRRADLKEIFPIWYRLGNIVPETPFSGYEGTFKLLEKCHTLFKEGKKLDFNQSFLNLFHAGFEGVLSPRLTDNQYQGFDIDEISSGFRGSPLALLTEGAKLISKLFVQAGEQEVKILPLLPPEFHCGRMLSISCGNLGETDIEWSKKTIRRMVFKSKVSGPVSFIFQKGLKSFRLRNSLKDIGKRMTTGEPTYCETGKLYLFDNFQK